MGDAIVWIGRHSLRFDALLQRLRLSATMRVRLAPGTAVDPPSPNDSDPDSNSDTPTSDSAAASHSAAHNPYDDGQSGSGSGLDSDSDGGAVVRTVTVSMALADARVASTLLLAVQAEEALALQVFGPPAPARPCSPHGESVSTAKLMESAVSDGGEVQGADEAFMGWMPRETRLRPFWKAVSRVITALRSRPQTWHVSSL